MKSKARETCLVMFCCGQHTSTDTIQPDKYAHDSTLPWRHNDHDGVSNHQPHGCLLNGLFGRRSKKTSKLRVTGLCAGNSPGPVNSPHKGPVTRKMFPFDDVIMEHALLCFVAVRYRLILFISFRDIPLAQGQSYEFLEVDEITLRNMGK